MEERTERDDELDGVADLIDEAAAELRASAGWVRDHLREALGALGVRDVNGSDPDDA